MSARQLALLARRYGRAAIPLLVLVLATIQTWSVPAALAHAGVAGSEPAANAVLATPPAAIRIWYTEPLVPGLGELQVLDAQGIAVEAGPTVVDSLDPRVMAASLAPLPNGTYVVAWTNISAIDGHKVRGSFLFSVGEPIGAVAPALTARQPFLPSPFEPVVRWLTLLSIMILAGALVFELAVARPALTRSRAADMSSALADRLATRLTVLMAVALGLFFAASLWHLLLQTSITLDVPFAEAIGFSPVAVVTGTGWGQWWLWRMASALVLTVLLGVRSFTQTCAQEKRAGMSAVQRCVPWLMLAAALGALLTLSLASHAAATAGIGGPAVANDFAHLLAASVWAGGLIALTASILAITRTLAGEARRAALSTVVARFSMLALLSVAVLAVTGLYSAWAQVTILPALRTPYGITLLAKLGLLVPILMLAALNLLWVRPRLPDREGAGVWLRRFVIGEAVLAILLLLPVGMLTALEPARQVASREGIGQPAGLVLSDAVDDVHVTVSVEPGYVGANQITVTLADRQNRPIDNATAVSVRATYLDADLGEGELSAAGDGDGRYAVAGVPLTIAGPWQVALAVRRPDGFDVRTAFRFELSAAGASGSAAIMPSGEVSQVLWGAEMALLGLALAGGGYWYGGRRTRRGVGLAAAGAIVLCTGVVLVIAALVGPSDRPDVLLADVAPPDATATAAPIMAAVDPAEIPATNPFPPDAASLAAGQRVFAEQCVLCHGLTGRGDGPNSVGLNPPPADLLTHIPIHADADLYQLVRDGKRFTAMPALGQSLTATEIWHLVNYLRAFEGDQRLAEDAFTRGLDYAGKGDDAQALATFGETIRLSPNHAQAYNARGVIHRHLGDNQQAIADHTKAIELEPAFVEAYLNRGIDHYEARDSAQAILDYDRALALDQELAPAYYARGLAHIDAGDTHAALRDFDSALQLNPNYARAYLDRGLIHSDLGNLQAARDDLAKYLELAPGAGNRAAVSDLIARLDNPIADAASTLTPPDALLLPADLPASFVGIKPQELGLAPDRAIPGVGVIQDVVAYGDSAQFELVVGVTALLTDSLQSDDAEAVRLRQNLLAFLQTGIDGDAVQQWTDLPAPNGLGNSAIGLTALLVAPDLPTRIDAVAFRSGHIDAYLFVMYGDGQPSTVSLTEVAHRLSSRLKSQ